MTVDEPERLAGNVGGAWRIGDTVHRATGPWTSAVHALLDYLASWIDCVPRVLGFDDEGREVLSYLPGVVYGHDGDETLLTAPQLVALVSWTRTFHDAVAEFSHPGPWRGDAPAQPTIIGHNDIAPYNACFAGDRLVGVFDWDMAGPTTPLDELAWIAWNAVPLCRPTDPDEAASRVELIAGTYGGVAPRDILDAVPRRMQRTLDWIPAAAAAGDSGMVNLMAHGEPQRSQHALDRLRLRLTDIAANLS